MITPGPWEIVRNRIVGSGILSEFAVSPIQRSCVKFMGILRSKPLWPMPA